MMGFGARVVRFLISMGVGAVCLVGNVVSSSSFIYPWQLFREAEFGSFVDVWGELLLEAVLRQRETCVGETNSTDLTYKTLSLCPSI